MDVWGYCYWGPCRGQVAPTKNYAKETPHWPLLPAPPRQVMGSWQLPRSLPGIWTWWSLDSKGAELSVRRLGSYMEARGEKGSPLCPSSSVIQHCSAPVLSLSVWYKAFVMLNCFPYTIIKKRCWYYCLWDRIWSVVVAKCTTAQGEPFLVSKDKGFCKLKMLWCKTQVSIHFVCKV